MNTGKAEIWTHPSVALCGPEIEYQVATTGGSALLSDGRVLMGYSGPDNPHILGPGETRIYGRASADGGKTWGPEREMMHHPECKAIGATLLRARDGTLWTFYMGFYQSVWKEGEPDMEATRSDLWCAHSSDDGETWVERQMIFKGYTGATNGAVETASGHFVVPFSYVVPGPGRLVSACVVSADGGISWKLGEHIDLGGHGDHAGALEPTVVQLRDGRVWMIIRTTMGRFWQAFSEDNGLTWSEATPTDIESPSAPGYVTRLRSGRLVFVWNNTMATTGERDTLSIALSENDGASWTTPVACARSVQLSYPFILEVSPGQLLVSCQQVMEGWKKVTPVLFRIREHSLLEG